MKTRLIATMRSALLLPRVTVRQEREWWDRFTWAADSLLSGEPTRQELGRTALSHLARTAPCSSDREMAQLVLDTARPHPADS